MKQPSSMSEVLFILLFLGIGFWNVHFFFSGANNTNDLMISSIPKAELISRNKILLTGYLIDHSSGGIMRNISLIADAYDANGRLIGSGKCIADSGKQIGPSSPLQYTCEITLSQEYRSIEYFMIIPRSNQGTGKLTTAYL